MLASSSRSSGFGIILTRSLPAPRGQWMRPGSSPVTAAGQRGNCTPFPNSTIRSYPGSPLAVNQRPAAPKPTDAVTNIERPGSGNPSASTVWSLVRFFNSHDT